jgi:Na+/melibiose symporter-like transporter
VILSAVTAFLISLPGAFQLNPIAGLPLMAFFTLAGAGIGYKRRNSDGFFYFTLVCSVALLSMIMYASFNAREQERIERETQPVEAPLATVPSAN